MAKSKLLQFVSSQTIDCLDYWPKLFSYTTIQVSSELSLFFESSRAQTHSQMHSIVAVDKPYIGLRSVTPERAKGLAAPNFNYYLNVSNQFRCITDSHLLFF